MPEEDINNPELRHEWAPAGLTREDIIQHDCTDLGNSERAARHLEGFLLYVPEAGYFRWNTTHWTNCSIEETHNILGRLFRDHRITLQQNGNDDDQRVRKWLRESEARSRLVAAECLLRGNRRILTDISTFDSQPYLLNFQNGTLNLRDGLLRGHDPNDRINRLLPYHYNPDATSQEFLDFIATITGGDCDLAAFLQRALGYTLCGLPTEEVLFFLYGTGANGKTTLVEVVKAALEGYAQKAPPSLLGKGKGGGPSPERARLKGMRMVICSELDESTPLGEAEIKDIVTRDTISARALYKEYFEFLATHVVWIMGNHRPRVSGTDDGIWRRILLVPFTVTIPEAERNPHLLGNLKRCHIPAIMNWMVEGARQYLENGLHPPQCVIQASGEYRHDMDAVQRFLSECCIREPDAEMPVSTLYEFYRVWTRNGGEGALAGRRFGQRLRELGFEQGRRAQHRFWTGIGIDSRRPDGQPNPLFTPL